MEIKNKYGYVRVSSKTQESNSSIESQKQQLIKNGIEEENIFVEVGSGANEIKNRSVFQKLINQKLKENDLLMVTKIDRCSRNTLEFLKLQDILFKKNITFVALDLPTSVDLATNKLMATTLSAMAEFENNRRKERQKQGIRAAQKKGKYQGRIANYLSDSFGFNSVVKETFQGKSEDLIFKITNEYKVSFIKSTYNPESNSHWTGLIVRFSGENGEYFYSLVQKKLIDWSIFDLSCTNIGRLDLYYFRKSKSTDQDDLLKLFMENSCEKVNAKSKRKKASWKRTSRGLILRIGNRSNSNYYHVYEKTKKINHDVYDEMNRGLEFELELKNQLIKSFQKFLFKNHLEEFEGKLVEHFYKYSKKSFVLDTCYTDWLQIGLRKIVSTQKSETNFNFLVSSYLRKDCLDSFVQKKQFFKLIQLFSFIRSLEYSKQFIDDQVYYVMEFAVIDFISFTGGNAKSTYQRTKALEFLTSLQDIKPLIQKFSKNEFRRSVMFPYLKLTKQNRRWTIIMAIGEELYFYQYPFFFPNSFLIYKNKYDLEIKLQLIESFSQVELEKKLLVKEFLNQFCVSNKDLTKIKKQLIDSVSKLKDFGLIENEFSLTFKNVSLNETKKIEDLSPGLLSKSESLSFWEKI